MNPEQARHTIVETFRQKFAPREVILSSWLLVGKPESKEAE